MPKLVTITPHSGIDYLLEVDKLLEGGVTRARTCSLFPAGKGVNAARTARSLGVETTVLGFVGLDRMPEFRRLEHAGISVHLSPVQGPTRLNVTLRDAEARRTTHVIGVGFHVVRADMRRLAREVERHVAAGDVVLLSGSWPSGAVPSDCRDLIDSIHRLRGRVVLDGSGAFLVAGLGAGPDVVKPNLGELAELCGVEVGPDAREVARIARGLTKGEGGTVVVTLGAAGAVAVSGQDGRALHGRVELDTADGVGDDIGSGDAFAAGLAAAMLEDAPLAEALKLGVACGAANLLTVGPGVCRSEDIAMLRARVSLEELAP